MTPWINGLTPTERIVFFDNPEPIRNRVRVNPALATCTMYGETG
jgi:hypothetical protein